MGVFDIQSMTNLVSASGALGVAAAGVVDGLKTLPGGGVSSFGFGFIRNELRKFKLDGESDTSDSVAASVTQNLHSNWINGMDSAAQRAVAKSLIKLNLTPERATDYANATHVDPKVLRDIAERLQKGLDVTDPGGKDATTDVTAANAQRSNTYGRFDLALTALLDSAYQRADQKYRNWSKLLAGMVALALALVAWHTQNVNASFSLYVLADLLAVPLAPVTKDLVSALSAGTKLAQALSLKK